MQLNKSASGVSGRQSPRASGGTRPDARTRRRTILASGAILVEDSVLAADQPLGAGYSPRSQIVLPYHGAFSWQIGRTDRLIDPNVTLFVTGGEEFFESHPIPDTGHGSAILTPSDEALDELRLARKAGFAGVARPMSDAARLTVHALLFSPMLEPLAREELAVELLADLTREPGPEVTPTRTIVERAKEVLHAHAHEVLSLDFVSNAVGVTPIYLTQVFRQTEGTPLYRYQTRLRLARALVELPNCESLTELALDLGFSSHSHFTSTFSASFGITPSAFRSQHVCHSRPPLSGFGSRQGGSRGSGS